mmetsp:Transcript_13196/g.16513  ORF Transcript_13196/g.16513 Transcript_13196/m.16513 type:complete len:486 (-) Transcript_13196:112-1569(-)
MDDAIRIVLRRQSKSTEIKSKWASLRRLLGVSTKEYDHLIEDDTPPVMPPAGIAPKLYLASDPFMTDMSTLYHDAEKLVPDISFEYEDGTTICTHCIALCCGSPFFCALLLDDKKKDKEVRLLACDEKTQAKANTLVRLAQNGSAAELRAATGLTIVQTESNFFKTLIHVDESIVPKCMLRIIIEHCVSGRVSGFFPDDDLDSLDALEKVASTLGCVELLIACQNIRQKEDSCFNASIETWLHERFATNARKLFLGKTNPQSKLMTGLVSLRVDDFAVQAHSSILAARSSVLRAALFWGTLDKAIHRRELDFSELTPQALQAVVDYAYTRSTPQLELDNGEHATAIIAAADRFDMRRLSSLAEIFVCLAVQTAISDCISKADIDIIELFLFARRHRADTLAKSLRHLIATNYCVFSDDDFERLKTNVIDDYNYIQRERWPPQSYLDELAAWTAKQKKKKDRTTITKSAINKSANSITMNKFLLFF